MLEKIEFFGGAIKFTPLFLILDILIIAHFFYTCFLSKSKWKIDPWHVTIFFIFGIPFMIMYPFSGSVLNYYCIEVISEKAIDKAFCIYFVGYLSFWGGRLFFDHVKIKYFSEHPRVLSWLYSKVIRNIESTSSLIFLCILSLMSTIFVLAIQIKNGRFFNIRDYFLENSQLRFIYNFSLSLYGMTLTYVGLNLIQKKNKRLLLLFLLLIFCTVFYGTRGLVLGSIVTYLLNNIYFNEGRCSFLKLGILGAFLIFLAINLDDLRHGYFQPANALKLFFFKIYYGNNFSDLRDFAWMLSYWDEKLLLGKTYVASLVSFIPRSLSDLRNDWGFSYYITDMVGLSQSSHAGLRPGIFGQVFFNFGYIGVIFSGLIAGYALRYSDVKLKEVIEKEKNIIKAVVYGIPYMFISEFCFGWVFWSFYFFIAMTMILVFISKIKLKVYSYPK
jgi:hypothetical protein